MSKEKETITVDYENREDGVLLEAFSNRVNAVLGHEITISPDNAIRITKITLIALSEFAALVKNKDNPIAVIIDDMEGNMILGCIVKYHQGKKKKDSDEEMMPGSWSCEWSFDKEDIKDCSIFKASDAKVTPFFISAAKRYGAVYTDESFAYLIAKCFAESLVEYLDNSAKEDSIVEIQLDEYFTASVAVEDDQKYMSFTPFGSILKKTIKSDADLEVVAD